MIDFMDHKLQIPVRGWGDGSWQSVQVPIAGDMIPFAVTSDDPVRDYAIPQMYLATYNRTSWERGGKTLYVLASLEPVYPNWT